MAFSSMGRKWGSWKAFSVGILCFLLALQSGAAYEFRVGGRYGWAIPNDTKAESYDQWAGRNRFQVGDSLLFVYKPKEDSVLQVTQENYRSCNTTNPIASFNDENTVFKFPHSGSFFFISGANGHCKKSEKLHVIVMTVRGKKGFPVSVPASAPAPAPALLTGKGRPTSAPIGAEEGAPSTSAAVSALQSAGIVGFMGSALFMLIF